MNDPVLTDLARYEQKQDEAEALDDFIEETADDLADAWYTEFCISGRIDELDWDSAEIKFLMAGHSVDAFTLMRNEAYKMVSANPEKYMPEPDYSEQMR